LHFFSRYFYIWRFSQPKESAYEEYCRSANLLSLYLINALMIFGMGMFLIIDYFRQVDYTFVFYSRLVYMLISLAIMVFAWKTVLKPKVVNRLILFALFILIVFSMVLSYFGRMPSFFLTNITVMVLMAAATISGLPFRYSLQFNIFLLVAFVAYSQLILPDPFYKSQYANISLMFVDSTIAGVLLEIRRRRTFLQFEDVTRQKKRIEELHEQKNKIISVLSHDVASPINSLAGLLHLQEVGKLTSEEAKQYAHELRKRLDNVSTMVYGLVRWSKSQVEGFVPDKKEVDAAILVQETAELFRPLAADKPVKISAVAEPNLFIYVDVEMIRIALRNLLSNAVKFSFADSVVAIRSYRTGNRIQVSFSNTSGPIEEERVKQMFSYQISSSEGTMGEKGTGLGLAMASNFVKANGGKIIFEGYQASTQTVTFVIELPAVAREIK
jgi:signal transduction histidine kinase